MIEKTKRRSAQFIDTLADRMASHPRIVSVFDRAASTMREALQSEGRAVLEELLLEMAQGEQLRLYVPKIKKAHRDARQQRIEAALGAKEATHVIAKRENVSERHVRRLRGRLVGLMGRTD